MDKDFYKDDTEEQNYLIKLISYDSMDMKRILLDWGIQGYGVTVGLILYLKKHSFLHLENIDLLVSDLKTSDFLIKKIIENYNFFTIDNNIVKIKI